MKAKKSLRVIGFMSLAVILVASLSWFDYANAVSPPGAKTLMVGALFSLTGPAAPAVKEARDGAIFAAEWINGKGGITIRGQRYVIEVVAEDDKSSPDAAVAATNKLVYKDKVKFIVGPVVPQCGIVMAPITEEAKVIRCNVNGTGTQAEINPKLRYTFATYKNINHVAPAYDYFIENYPMAKKVAIMGPDDPGGQGAAPVSQKEAKKRRLEVVFTELYPFGTEDFYPILTKALDQKPDAIDMTVGITPWFAGIIKQARQLGFKGPMFTSCPTGDIYLLRNIVGKDFAYNMFFMEPDLKSPKMTPIIQEIMKWVKEKHGIEAQYAHASGWEALWVTAQAIESAQSLDTTAVAQSWEKMKSIETLYGKGRMGGLDTFGINHVIIKPVPVTRLNDGEVEFVKFISR